MRWAAAWAATLVLAALPARADPPTPSKVAITLTGEISRADHQAYLEVPFKVPAGATGLSVSFTATGREDRTVIDIGLRDPERLRGWSGGNKSAFTLSETWATPSYLPGPLPEGEWRLILGVPNIREGARAQWAARVTIETDGVFRGFPGGPRGRGPGWYAGDLHAHTAHSDGSCPARSGDRAPCPLSRTVEAAAARGLDFVAVTEHNTPSHHQALAELQPAFDTMVLIPGREITTFQGHANMLGVTAPLDFQNLDRALTQAKAAGGFVSINHPALPSGEVCMGCGWTAPVDYARIDAVEVVNGAMTSGPLSGMAFWEARLNEGRRITGIGGSDNHDATLTGARGVGAPTTRVWAEALTHDAILAGLRAGRVVIDAQGAGGRSLDLTYQAGGVRAAMGGELPRPRDGRVVAEAAVEGVGGGRLVLRGGPDFQAPEPALISEGATGVAVLARVAPTTRWLRADIVGPGGRPWLIGNPVYLASEGALTKRIQAMPSSSPASVQRKPSRR